MKRFDSAFNTISVVLIVLVVLLLSGCNKDEFKDSSLAIADMLGNAKKMLKAQGVENMSENGKVESTVVTFDNASAKKYLKSNMNKIEKYYNTIEKHYDPNNTNFIDALFMLSFTNEMVYWLSGDSLRPRCTYLKRIKSVETIGLSEWMINEVFAPFINKKDNIKTWSSMDHTEKAQDIHEFLMVGYKDAGC